MEPELPRHDEEVRRAFLAFAGPLAFRRFVAHLHRVKRVGRRQMLSWQRRFWQVFARSSAQSLPDTFAAIARVLAVCEVHTQPFELHRLPLVRPEPMSRAYVTARAASFPNPGDCSACSLARRQWLNPDASAVIRAAFVTFAGRRRYEKLVERAIIGRLVTIDRELWATFTRATTLPLPDGLDAMTALFRVCRVHDTRLRIMQVRVLYGLVHFSERYFAARRQQFPHADEAALGGCVMRKPRQVAVPVCDDCIAAKRSWSDYSASS